ncbi:MAG: hypothetical protein COB98_07330 [Flavobacteriaceae bacterium]|nr:MAG: hypothetical protein COB98_07330 [Flavobacteriaceae bacterium]
MSRYLVGSIVDTYDCPDADGDLVDLDDDNDEVLDTTELSCGNGTAVTTTATTTAGSQFIEGRYTNGDAVANYSIDLSDVSVALITANKDVGSGGGHYDFSAALTSISITQTLIPQVKTVIYGLTVTENDTEASVFN